MVEITDIAMGFCSCGTYAVVLRTSDDSSCGVNAVGVFFVLVGFSRQDPKE